MILNSYKFLVARLLVDSGERVRQQLNSGKDGFTARNDSQAYFCRSLSLAFIEVSTQCFSSLVFNPFKTNIIFHLATYNEVRMVHYVSIGVTGCNFQKIHLPKVLSDHLKITVYLSY